MHSLTQAPKVYLICVAKNIKKTKFFTANVLKIFLLTRAIFGSLLQGAQAKKIDFCRTSVSELVDEFLLEIE